MAHTASRSVLTAPQVLEIFMLKNSGNSQFSAQNGNVRAKLIGQYFHVSSKTIRDIWTGRTWYRETHHLDPTRSDARERLDKRPGRPKGAKDSKPRVRKVIAVSKKTNQFSSGLVCTKALKDSVSWEHIPSEHIVSMSCPSSARETKPTVLLGTDGADSLRMDWDTESATLSFSLPVEDNAGLDFDDPFHDDWKYWTSST